MAEGGGVRQTDGAQPPKGALVCRGLYAAPREVPVPVTVCSLQGRAVARIKERSPRSLPPLPQGDKRCHTGLDPARKKIVPPKGRSSCKSPINGWLIEGAPIRGSRRHVEIASQPVSDKPPDPESVVQHSHLERRRDNYTPRKHLVSINGWLIEDAPIRGSRRHVEIASQPVSDTPPAPESVVQHSHLERRRRDKYTPRKHRTGFNKSITAHRGDNSPASGHLPIRHHPDYTNERFPKSAGEFEGDESMKMKAHMGYPSQTQMPMPKEEHEFLGGNHRFLLSRHESEDTIDNTIKDSMYDRKAEILNYQDGEVGMGQDVIGGGVQGAL
ncbi:hypothetical protein AAG570_005012 [Ranatra chinensis]|uniref:Uncharacterized protein n=1 Tax=Ranatra chinensis TaxID=642074 RepID=A0ABD0YMU2_9HEMI